MSEPSTFLDALVAALQRAGSYDKNDHWLPSSSQTMSASANPRHPPGASGRRR